MRLISSARTAGLLSDKALIWPDPSWVGTYGKPPESSLNVRIPISSSGTSLARHRRRRRGLAFGGCAKAEETAAKKPDPVKIEKIPGMDLERMTLEPQAAERIGIQTHPVDGTCG